MRSLCFLSALLLTLAGPSRANTIDDFTSPNQSVCDPVAGACLGPGTSSTGLATNTVSGNRQITVTSGGGGAVFAEVGGGQLSYTADPSVTGTLLVTWDFLPSVVDFTFLGSGFGFQYSTGIGGLASFEAFGNGGTAFSKVEPIPNSSSGTATFNLADFTGYTAALNQVETLTFRFEAGPGGGVIVDPLAASGRLVAFEQDYTTFDNFAAVPELSTLAFLGPALAGLLAFRRRLQRRSARRG